MKTYFLKKIKGVTLLMLTILCSLLCSCGEPSADLELYDGPYSCDISWRYDDRDFFARVSVDGQSVFLDMTSPEGISELWLKKDRGGASYGYGELTLGEPPEHYLRIADIFLRGDGFDFLCRTRTNGKETVCYTRGGDRWYFSTESGKLVLIENGELLIRVSGVSQ